MLGVSRGGRSDPAPPEISTVASAAGVIASVAGLMMLRARIAAELTAVGFDARADIDDADAIGAGAFYHFNIDSHILLLVDVVFGFEHMVHHVGEHGAHVTVGQLVQHVPPLPTLLQQTPRAQQPEVLRHEALADADLIGKFTDRAGAVQACRDEPQPVRLPQQTEQLRKLGSFIVRHANINI